MRLEGRTAIVTGGARGIGGAIARCLAEEGARVALGDLDGPAARATASGRGRGSIGLAADAADEGSIAAAVAEAAETFGGLDIMVNNAGAARGDEMASEFQPVPPFTNLDQESWGATLL